MSRIGKMPIAIPAGVTVEFNNGVVTVKGPKGTLNREIVGNISVEAEGRVDFADSAKTLAKLAKSKLGVTPKFAVVPIGTLSRSEKKTKRVEDQRDL